jgi:hypothetical protein
MSNASRGVWSGFGLLALLKAKKATRSRRARGILAVEVLEDRRVLAIVEWSAAKTFNQFNGNEATIIGVGFDDGEPDANGDGKSDASGVKKKPDFFGFDFNPDPFKLGGIKGEPGVEFGAEVSLDARLKAGFEYGYYVNGGSASILADGAYAFDVSDTVVDGRLLQRVDTTLVEQNSSLFTVSPKLGAYVDLLVDFNVDISAAAAFFGKVQGSTSFGFGKTIPLLSFNRQKTNPDGSPMFREDSGAPALDGQFLILGSDPLGPLVELAKEIQESREKKGEGASDKQKAQREKDTAKTNAGKDAAQSKIDAANTKINNAKAAEKNSVDKTKNKSGKGSTNTIAEVTYAVSQPDTGLIGGSVDFGIGLGVPGTNGQVTVGKKLGNATIGYPDFSLSDTDQSDGVLRVSTDKFQLGEDADKARSFLSGTYDIANLFSALPFGSALGTFTADLGPISAEITTASYNVTVASKINQDASASISGRDVRYKFLDPVTRAPVAITALVGDNRQAFPGMTQIDVGVRTPVLFDTGNREVLVEQELINKYTFSNRIGMEIGVSGKLTVLKASLTALGAEIFSIGPLYELEHPIATIPLFNFVDRTFTVTADPVSVGSFRIGQPVTDLKVTVSQDRNNFSTGVGGSMQPVVYTATVTNGGIQGLATATGTVFEFELPEGYSLNPAGATTAGFTQTGRKIRYNIGNLPANGSRVFEIHALTSGRDMSERVTSRLSVRANERELKREDNSTSIDTITLAPRDLMVTVGGDSVENPDFNTIKSLRAAVAAAEANPGRDIISFHGTGDLVIELEQGEIVVNESVDFVNALQNGGRVILRGRKSDAPVNGPKHSRILHLRANGADETYNINGLTFEEGSGIGQPQFFNPANVSIVDGFGGAIYSQGVFGSNIFLDIRNSVFRNNSTNRIENSSGGALATIFTKKVTLENVLFEGNSSYFGGAASLTDVEDSLLTRVVFDRNKALKAGGAFDTYSEFGFAENSVRIEEAIFTGNKAGKLGAAIFNEAFGGDSELEPGLIVPSNGLDSKLTFKSSLFTNNGPLDLADRLADSLAVVPDISTRDTSASGNPITISEGNNFSEDPTIAFTNPSDKRGVATGILFDKKTLVVEPLKEGEAIAAISVLHPFATAPFKFGIEELQPNGTFLDSDKFEVVAGALKLKKSFQFNPTAGFVSLRITATDVDGLKLVRAGVIVIVVEPPLPPTDIAISNLTVAENSVGAVIGTVTVTDASTSDAWTFFVTDERFEVDFIQPPGLARQYRLKVKAGQVLDFEVGSGFAFDVQATDSTGLFTKKRFEVVVSNVGEPPREVRVSGKGIREGRAGDVFGAIFVNDPDSNETHVVTVDDARFEVLNVVGADNKISSRFLKLKGNVELKFADAAIVNVKVTATDSANLSRTIDVAIPVIDNTKPNRGNVVQVFRAFNPNADFHFFTTNRGQFEFAVNAGYRDEAEGRPAFSVHSEPIPGTTALFRLYNLERGFHYYTANKAEADMLAALVPAPTTGPDTRTTGWRFEGTEGFMYGGEGAQTTILYRLYNNNSGTHLFTVDESQKNAILAAFPGIWVEHSPVGFAFNLQANGVLPGLDNFKPPTPTNPPPAASAVAAPATSAATSESVFLVGPSATTAVATDLDVGLIAVNTTAAPATVDADVEVADDSDDDEPAVVGPLTQDDSDEVEALDSFWSAFDTEALLMVGAE